MIQRIQTVYLLISAICISCGLFLSMAATESGNAALSLAGWMGSNGLVLADSSTPLIIMMAAPMLLCVMSILMFKNRKVQIRMVQMALLSSAVMIFFLIQHIGDSFELLQLEQTGIVKDQALSYKLGFFLPVAAVAFLILALRGISKDEKLVKSLDRLR